MGAMIHTHYLMSKDFKSVLANAGQASIIRTVDSQLEKMFDVKLRRPLQKQNWLIGYLQHPEFRYLIGEILSRSVDSEYGNEIIVAQTTINVERYLSNLTIAEFIALSSENCNDSTRMKIKINNGIPTYLPKQKYEQSLTRKIVQTYLYSQNKNPNFFKFYSDSLRLFLPDQELELTARGKKWTENSRFLNKEMWLAWEWLLNIMKEDQSEYVKEIQKSSKKRPAIIGKSPLNEQWTKAQNNRYLELHRLLRINYNESLDEIYNQIEKNYTSIAKRLTSADAKNAMSDDSTLLHDDRQKLLQPIAHEIMRFTSVKINDKSNQSQPQIEWLNPMRIIYSQVRKSNRGDPIHYVDWEICFDLWKNLPGRKLKHSFSDVLEESAGVIAEAIYHRIEHSERIDVYISFEDIVKMIQSGKDSQTRKKFETRYEGPRIAFNYLLDFMNSILANDSLEKLKLGLQHSFVSKSIFGESYQSKSVRNTIVENLIAHLMDYYMTSGITLRPVKEKIDYSQFAGIKKLDGYHRKYIVTDDPEA